MAGGAPSGAPGTLAKPLLESQAPRAVAGRHLSGDSAPRRQSSAVPASEEGTEYFTPRSTLGGQEPDLGPSPAPAGVAAAAPPDADRTVSRCLSSARVRAVVLLMLALFAAMAYYASEGPGRPGEPGDPDDDGSGVRPKGTALRWPLLVVVVMMAAGLCCMRPHQRPSGAAPGPSPGRLPGGGGPRIIEEEPPLTFCGGLAASLSQGRDRADTRPFEVNSKEGVPVQASGFRGRVLFLHLPDWDTAAGAPATASAVDTDNWAHHRGSFEGRKRRFEFRLQGTFDAAPGEACEAFFCSHVPPDAVSMDFWGNVLVKPVIAFINKLNSGQGTGLRLNVEGVPQDDGSVLVPSAVWPLLGADTLVVTPRGEEPPALDSPQLSAHSVPRSARAELQLDNRHTYTFVFHSMYGDFVRRELTIMGLCFRFEDYIGRSSVFMSVYRLRELAETGSCDLHRESNKDYVLSLELGRCGHGRSDADAV